jgi:hypothetical protein
MAVAGTISRAPLPPAGTAPPAGAVHGAGAAPPAGAAKEKLQGALALVRLALGLAPPETVSGAEAAELARCLGEAKRLVESALARYGARVHQTAAHRDLGHRDGADWLAQVSGESPGRARGAIEAAAGLEASVAREAFCAGELSLAQAQVIAGAAAVAPGAAAGLVEVAKAGDFGSLTLAAARAKRVARGEAHEEEQEARAHAGRYVRTTAPDTGGLRLEAFFPRRLGARVLAALGAETEAVFAETRGEGTFEPLPQARADALVRLVLRGAERPPGDSLGPLGQVVLRVDVGALRRGAVEGDEVCEIDGVGSVPVGVAKEVLGDGLFTLVVTDGCDIATVTSTTRSIPGRLRAALCERDRTCVVPGCGVAHHLEIDHWRLDYALGGRTALDNLARLCGRHHALKTTLKWRLEGGPGHWQWLPPQGGAPPPGRRRPAVRRT